ncbi:choice-of-anchor I family protein [Abyssalbus ytuae]|uniref:Choice-of-anchor I family protein n=1 Tax=Abyssalbus ytuae TaxID=2926907 RepID=A0A9E6ZVJ8_9FLAO|nr:choice-of-anchor I family protein [Abyssalbus ytuae]UOB18568.1 choice-of-anchor I family protein [Abyssalbus ytuae]
MKLSKLFFLLSITLVVFSCSNNDDKNGGDENPVEINFQHLTTINAGGTTEITAFDPLTNKIFVVNPDDKNILVYNLTNVTTPVEGSSIDVSSVGSPNSVAVSNGKLAVAVEAPVKQNSGSVLVYDTDSQSLQNTYTVGALPDMLTFTPDGTKIIVANEGEPNSLYNNDPKGTVSIIELSTNNVTNLDFDSFNSQTAALAQSGFRVFGPNADLSEDVEPEYVAVSDDSKTAWVSLQENNGIARVNLGTKNIEEIYPLGFKNYNLAGNEIDPSDKDDLTELNTWPVYGMYQPDALEYVNINGTGYVISANEGDAREYIDDKGTDDEEDDEEVYVEEIRVKDVDLDPVNFPAGEDYGASEKLGRLKITTTLGNTDADVEFEELYSFGARSFSIWSATGSLVYDSGNEIAERTLSLTPASFNADDGEADGRSDDKGAEPETVEALIIGNKTILFVGLERNSQVLVYDISNPAAPEFIQILQQPGDEAPEGVLAIAESDSPSGKALLIVTNEDSGTISIYQN